MNSPPENQKRKYQVIWDKLKLEGKCIVKCRQEAQKRIIKAVCKEKDKDLNKDKSKVIHAEKKDDKIVFTFIKKIVLQDL